MLDHIRQLFRCFTRDQKRSFIYLQALIVAMSLLEVISIALIGPFLTQLMNGDENQWIIEFFSIALDVDNHDLIQYVGIFILLVLIISTMVSVLTTYLLAMFSAKTGAELSDRLFKYYCEQDILYHNNQNTSLITKNLSTETLRLTDLVINPLMQMNAKIVLSLFIFGFIFFVNPLIALIGISFFIFTYYLIYMSVKVKLDVNGRNLTDVISKRFLVINECFGGINEVILLNKKEFFHNKYKILGRLYSKTRGANHAISLAPRYLVELIVYGAIVTAILIIILFYPDKTNSYVNLIALYAVASLKLLPALQHIFTSITQIRGNISSFNYLKTDLLASNSTIAVKIHRDFKKFESLEFQHINFKYPNNNFNTLKDVSLTINRNDCIAFVGPSGSGKSTLINVILGHLIPTNGEILINGKTDGFHNYANRGSVVGYVPQNIYLTDNTIRENIAFGIDAEHIDSDRLKTAIGKANLGEFVASLEHGLETCVGERGVQVSGGQKQRIGIARALYNDPDILIFDEATSALDGNSEKIILQSMNSILRKKTIIMIAHRLNTVKNCDTIYIMDNGEIVESGSFNKLITDSKLFQEMFNVG